MSLSPFVTLIFRGERFQKAAMPLEALPELAAYRELVLAVAKVLFQVENPDRQRLPKGFEAGFRLVLERVESGSAIPVVSRVSDEPTMKMLFPTAAAPDWFDKARDVVEHGIAAAAKGQQPAELSKEILARFNAFGRTLGEDESIIVAQPGKREGAVYDRVVRRRLVLQAQATYEDEVNLLGEVRAADKDAEGFALRTSDGRKLDVHAPPLFFPLALRSLGESALVRVRGTGLYDADGTLLKVTMASDVSLAEEGEEQTRPGCPTPVEIQVESLKALAAGWYDESSPAYEPSSLAWLGKLLLGLLDGFQLPRPYIYPTPEGLARAEWSGAAWEIVSSFDLDSRSVEVMAARTNSDEMHEITVPLAEPGGESKLGRFLTEHLATH
ncbi:MAG: hypothetical protein M3O46_05105 [Myxococcota bacterium]|nr:hypothetical protein [Myxococcota bacterium]